VKIAFVSENAEGDKSAFSGIPYYMSKALQGAVADIQYIYAPMFDWKLMFSDPQQGRKSLEAIGEAVSRELVARDVDAVICQGTSMIPYLDTCKPLILWHDSTWQCLMQVDFDEFRSCHPLLWEWDNMTLNKCNLAAYAADWVRNETITHYNVNENNLAVVPFGPSIDPPSEGLCSACIGERSSKQCNLTFIGVDWVRKGLPIAYSLMDKLNRKGLPTILNVIGVGTPDSGAEVLDGVNTGYKVFNTEKLFLLRLYGDRRVKIHGKLDKTDAQQYEKFNNVISHTHFLVHPAIFECFGVVLAEANAYGVPVLATDGFGPQSIIRNKLNGRLFEREYFVQKAAEFVIKYMMTYDDYLTLAQSSFNEFNTRLNWDVNARLLLEYAHSLCARG